MVKEIRFFCDICSKEFPPQEYSFLIGQLIKVDKDLKSHTIPFEGHYCDQCTNLILGEITKLKNASYNDTTPIPK